MTGESSTTAMKTPFVTGERVVVAVVVSRVLFSLPLSLISHGFSLFLLSLSAFLVEIRAETSPFLLSRFSARKGASSGIFLGAVTLPAVMLSKLVQLTRAISLHAAEQDALAHVTMQYWAASASCCAILTYLSVIMSQAKKTESSSSSSSLWLTSVSLTGTILYGAACFVSLSMISHTGLNTSLKMLWMLFHGLAAVKLIRHLLCTFPSCASIGEALLVTSGLVLYFGDFLACTIAKPKFLDIAFGAALAVFVVLEIVQIWRIKPLGEPLHQFMNAFTDHRDSELLIVSHFSLLLGCALPIWMSSGFNDRALSPFAGILSIGIGDTMASMVGHKYGVLRWSKTGKKTVEGTAAGITSVMAVCFVLVPVLASMGYILSQGWWSLLVAVTATGMLEAYTAQLDNAFIPLVFYSLLCL